MEPATETALALLAQAGWLPDLAPVPVKGGWDNHIWRFERNGSSYGLRLWRAYPGADPPSLAASAGFEAAAIEVAARAGIPAPEIVARGEFEGTPYFIMRWLPGETLIDVAKRAPWRTRRLGRQFGRLQARLHRIPGEGLRRVLDTDWIERAEVPALIDYVRAELHAGSPVFCHFDYHPLNVLAEGTRITGLVDFANASASDRRADLGLTNAVLVAAPAPPGLARSLVQVVRRRFVAGWREGYIDYAGHFPLEPAFEALGYALHLHEFSVAVGEGRGWAGERDLLELRRRRDDALARAGLASDPGRAG